MADGGRAQQPWGRLVRVGACTGSALSLLLVNPECTVGRRKGCDLSFPANKLVSGDHCKISQDQTSGQVWLEDMSTNGTVINMSKLVKRQSHLLQNGDVIYFVYRKNEPEQNVAYVYHSISPQQAAVIDDEVELRDRINTEVDPAPVEPVTLPSVPCEVQLRAGFEESQPSTSYNIDISGFTDLSSAESSAKPVEEDDDGECEEPSRKKQKTDPVAPEPAPPKPGKDEKATKTDKMEESLTCIICQDLLHDCVSLQPCMHTFCAACYSGWMERSSLCPTCRCPVERIRKNHILNNLVEAYLLQHPEKSRSEEDLHTMDARNKITQDMLQPKVERYFSDEDGSSDYLFELSDNDSDTSDLSQPYLTCRQCPSYRKDLSPAPWMGNRAEEAEPTARDGPSTSSSENTVLEGFQCPPLGNHLICTCCMLPMPDRRAEHISTSPSPQHCLVCQRPFCHLYWGCQRIGCQGCLAPFSDLNLTDKCMDGVLSNNHYESEILKNFLSSRGKTWKEMLQETLQAAQQGAYGLSDYRINADSFLCYCCGLRFFKEIAFIYRQNIPATDLPVAVTARPDCYWGRNCRTQIKAHHAMRFNHICEQTRFKN